MAKSLEILVDEPTCISSGYCRNAAPDVFGAKENRKTMVKANPVEETPAIWEALEGCPVEALSARDTATGETVFP